MVVLPLALALPGAMPVLPAIIVTQTFVELASELAYVRVLGKLTDHDAAVTEFAIARNERTLMIKIVDRIEYTGLSNNTTDRKRIDRDLRSMER